MDNNLHDLLVIPASLVLVLAVSLVVAVLSYLWDEKSNFNDRFFGFLLIISFSILVSIATYGLVSAVEWACKVLFLQK